MTQEEFKTKNADYKNQISSLEGKVRELKKELHQLREDYIEQFREFKNGDLVSVTHGRNKITEKAFISSASEYNGEIDYTFIQVKKDGTPSSRKLYIDNYSFSPRVTIELINTEYRNKNFDGTPITENH